MTQNERVNQTDYFGVFVLSSTPELQNQALQIQVNQIDY